MNKKSTMITNLKGDVKIGTANPANPTLQEIAGICPFCGNQIRIPIKPIIDAKTYIDELEHRLYDTIQTMTKEKVLRNDINQKLYEIKDLLNDR